MLVATAATLAQPTGAAFVPGHLQAGGVLTLKVTSYGGVPASGVEAVALNVTAVDSTASSFLTVWPTGSPRPTASNLNFSSGQTVPNLVIVKVGDQNSVSFYNQAGTVDVIVDLLGWFGTGVSADFISLGPSRVLDTRNLPTIDGEFANVGSLGPSGSTDLVVGGRVGVPTWATAVALNVTAIAPTADSFVTVWPSGTPRPTASNLNLAPGRTRPNMVIVPLGADGKVSLFNQAGRTDLAVDVLGYFIGNGLRPMSPTRALDTRPQSTADHQFEGVGAIGPGKTIKVKLGGRLGMPSDLGGGVVALNVTAVSPTMESYLTLWPGGDRPYASSLNFRAGQTVPNMVLALVGPDGTVSIYNNSGSVQVIVDVLGWWPVSQTGFHGMRPSRLLDTRYVDLWATFPTISLPYGSVSVPSFPVPPTSPSWP